VGRGSKRTSGLREEETVVRLVVTKGSKIQLVGRINFNYSLMLKCFSPEISMRP
jgi:hypothetical protein